MADMAALAGFDPIQNRGLVLLRFVSGFTQVAETAVLSSYGVAWHKAVL